MILLIDNYDSFSYNLYQLIGSINPDIKVVRNDKVTIQDIETLNPEAIFLSPGPGRPEDAGVCIQVIQELGQRFPIFGVCLGHQAICHAYGGQVSYAPALMHGKTSQIQLDTSHPMFAGMDKQVQVARYHSLVAVPEALPECLQVTAQTVDGVIMAVAHKDYPVFGVQFHPESVLTPQGQTMIKLFLEETSHD